MVPFYTFYSMFGFQRVGDLIWQAADARARGFLMGATAGRTTLLGEGLQHQDGHSLVLASTVPRCRRTTRRSPTRWPRSCRPACERMYGAVARRTRDVFYYLTLYNENYPMPAAPDVAGPRRGHRPRPVPLRRPRRTAGTAGHGAVQRLGARRRPRRRPPRCSSATTSASTCGRPRRTRRCARRRSTVERWNRLHPGEEQRTPLVAELLADAPGPIVAVTDFMKIVPEQVARWLPGRTFIPLGTDGMGRSDTREALRRYFEVDEGHVVVAVLSALAAQGAVGADVVAKAIGDYGIDPDAPTPGAA